MQVHEWLSEKIGQDIWEKKYRFENETLDEWFVRVSGGNKEVQKLIEEKKFLFGGRILASRGLNKHGKKITYSNCFVLDPPQDNIESIFDCAKKMARTYSAGGGVGVDISKLRPKNAITNNAAKESSGAVSFSNLYDLTTSLISQNGRRGALMLSLSCEHPDLEDFIDLKTKDGNITKANISVRITDEFMQAVKYDKPWTMKFVVDSTGEVIEKTSSAKELFMKLVSNNYDWAEPGLLYWDAISKWNLLSEDKEFEYAGVNP